MQNSETYESICEGGLSCIVDAGSYIVINLTTGARYENVIVDSEVDSVATVGKLWTVLSGDPVRAIDNLFLDAFENGEPMLSHSVGDYTVIGVEREEDGYPVWSRFSCSGGGMYEKPAFQNHGYPPYSKYVWKACTIDGITYDGTIEDSSGQMKIHGITAYGGDKLLLEADGYISSSATKSGSYHENSWGFKQFYNSETGLSLSESFVIESTSVSVAVTNRVFEVQLYIDAPWLEGEAVVSVSNDESLTAEYLNGESNQSNQGSIELNIGSGNRRIMLDAATGNANTFMVTDAVQDSVTSEVLDWSALRNYCSERSDVTGVWFALSLCYLCDSHTSFQFSQF